MLVAGSFTKLPPRPLSQISSIAIGHPSWLRHFVALLYFSYMSFLTVISFSTFVTTIRSTVARGLSNVVEATLLVACTEQAIRPINGGLCPQTAPELKVHFGNGAAFPRGRCRKPLSSRSVRSPQGTLHTMVGTRYHASGVSRRTRGCRASGVEILENCLVRGLWLDPAVLHRFCQYSRSRPAESERHWLGPGECYRRPGDPVLHSTDGGSEWTRRFGLAEEDAASGPVSSSLGDDMVLAWSELVHGITFAR